MLVVFGRHEWANSNTPASTGPTGTLKSHGYLTSDYQLPFWMVMPYGISPFSDTLIYHEYHCYIHIYIYCHIAFQSYARECPLTYSHVLVESSSFFAKNTWREVLPFFRCTRSWFGSWWAPQAGPSLWHRSPVPIFKSVLRSNHL